MIITKIKRKVVITSFEVNKLERFRPFDVRIPSNAIKVTRILVTASEK